MNAANKFCERAVGAILLGCALLGLLSGGRLNFQDFRPATFFIGNTPVMVTPQFETDRVTSNLTHSYKYCDSVGPPEILDKVIGSVTAHAGQTIQIKYRAKVLHGYAWVNIYKPGSKALASIGKTTFGTVPSELTLDETTSGLFNYTATSSGLHAIHLRSWLNGELELTWAVSK